MFDTGRVGVSRLLTSLARNISTEAALSTLAADTGGGDRPLDARTAAAYLTGLQRLFVSENPDAWWSSPLPARLRT